MTRIFLTSGTAWTVPSDWNNLNNTIEVIGAGGGGSRSNSGTNVTAGGGGGQYAKINNLTLTPSSTVQFQVGVKGTGATVSGANGGTGTDTFFNGATIGAASVGGKGGTGGTSSVGGSSSAGKGGGQTGNTGGVGTTINNGGNGGFNPSNASGAGAGGGGAGGPNGAGASGGGITNSAADNGGSGGGASGGGSVGATSISNNGVAGGANFSASQAGGAGTTNNTTPGTAGTGDANGASGGGGGFGNNVAGTTTVGGDGGAGKEWDSTHGSGAGGGGGGGSQGASGSKGGVGGGFGGGGAGGGYGLGNGGDGADGIIVITYFPNSFTYYTAFTVNTGQVPSTQTDFPVGIIDNSGLARLADIGHGGHVQNSNGYDIRPFSDSALTTPLPFELVSYTASSGAIEMWVKVPSLSDGYVIYLAYGDSTISADASTNATWNTNFKEVYHYKTTGSPPVALDSTSTGNTNTANSVTITSTTGQIGLGIAVDSSSSHQMAPASSIALSGTFSVSAWWNKTSNVGVNLLANDAGDSAKIGTNGANIFARYISGGTADTSTIAAPSTGTWHFVKWIRDGSNKGFVSIDGGAYVNIFSNAAQSGTWTITRFTYGANGSIDEQRISTINDSADWTKTEYNNQFAPTTFYAVGAEQTIGASTNTNFFLAVY